MALNPCKVLPTKHVDFGASSKGLRAAAANCSGGSYIHLRFHAEQALHRSLDK